MKIILSIFLFCFTCSLTTGSQCDKDWIYNEGNCYWSSYNLLAKEQPIEANWFGAQLYCQELGGNLAHFSNNFEMNLISMLAACSPTWIGLVYKHTPATKGWVWWNTCDEAAINKSVPVCGTHQPTTARLDPKGIIVAEFSEEKLPFVCKREANPEDPECLTTVSASTVSTSATTTTTTATTSIATTTTSESARSTESTADDNSGDYHYPGDFSGDAVDHGSGFTSDTTKRFKAKVRSTSPALSTVTASAATHESSLSTAASSSEPTTTIKRSCNRTCSTGFLDEDSTCCPTILNKAKSKRFYDENTSKCYYLPIERQAPVDYFAAQLLCQEQNMHLSSIHSAEENQIVGFLSMCRSTWIGLENVKPSEVCNCRGWAWEDYSSEFKNNTLCDDFQHNFFQKNLAPLAPVCIQSAQCGYIYPQAVHQRNQYYWKNCNCYELLNFVCVQ